MKKLILVYLLVFLVGITAGVVKTRQDYDLSMCMGREGDLGNYESSPRYQCFADMLKEITAQRGPGFAVKTLDTYRAEDPNKEISEARCHSLGHVIGQVAVRENYSQEEIIRECGSSCVGGCLNGASHTYMFDGATIPELEQFCELDNSNEDTYSACYHGIGHALVEYTQIDLPATLGKCSEIKSEIGRYQCGHAAVMDYGIAASAPNPKLPIDVVHFCSTIDPVMRKSCFEFVGFLEYSRTLDIQMSLNGCAKIPKDFQELCQRRTVEAMIPQFMNDVDLLVAECSKGNDEELNNCIIHTLQVMSANSVTEVGDHDLVRLCQKLPMYLRDNCEAEYEGIVNNKK